jgi:RNA polymerase sigma-70 factor, ECF subfamily
MASSPPLERDHELQLVKQAQDGDRRALDELLRAHRDRIWGVCRRITGSDADAQDATQEASIAIMRHIAKFDGNSAFSTWIYRIATNASLDELRRRKRRAMTVGDDTLLDSIGSSGVAGVAAFVDASSAGGFDSRIADRMRIDAALSKLPADFRAAVVLRDLCDLDYNEIAEVLGIPAGTVRSRIARGRAALGPLLANTDGVDSEAENSGVVDAVRPPGATKSGQFSTMTDDTSDAGNQTATVARLSSRTVDPSDSSIS